MPHAGEVGTYRACAGLIEWRRNRTRRCRRDDGFERGEHALTVGLTERNKPHARGNPVRRQRMEKGVKRGFAGDAMSSAGHADSDR